MTRVLISPASPPTRPAGATPRISGPRHGAALTRPVPLTDPQLRLVVLHHAGGSHVPFRRWARLLPAGWEACLVDAPGRGSAADRPPVRTMDELVAAVIEVLAPLADRPFVLFGHSMGALVGLAVAAELTAAGDRLPTWLGVSAHPGPSPARDRPAGLHLLDGPGLRAALHDLGGLPRPLRYDDDLWAQVEPLVRADLEVVERWRPAPVPALPVPLSAFGGLADPVAPAAGLHRWAARSERFQGVLAYPGDHFYFRSSPAPLIAGIEAEVLRASAGGPGPDLTSNCRSTRNRRPPRRHPLPVVGAPR